MAEKFDTMINRIGASFGTDGIQPLPDLPVGGIARTSQPMVPLDGIDGGAVLRYTASGGDSDPDFPPPPDPRPPQPIKPGEWIDIRTLSGQGGGGGGLIGGAITLGVVGGVSLVKWLLGKPGASGGGSPAPSGPTAPVFTPGKPVPQTPANLNQFAKGTAADGRISIDPSLTGKGLLGHTDSNGRVTVAPEAFATPGLLKAVVDHEAAHVRQIGEGRFHAFKNTPADYVNEIEALRAGMARPVQPGADPILDGQRAKWQAEVDRLIEKLAGTPYQARVQQTPPDYTLMPLDKCPGNVCFLK